MIEVIENHPLLIFFIQLQIRKDLKCWIHIAYSEITALIGNIGVVCIIHIYGMFFKIVYKDYKSNFESKCALVSFVIARLKLVYRYYQHMFDIFVI